MDLIAARAAAQVIGIGATNQGVVSTAAHERGGQRGAHFDGVIAILPVCEDCFGGGCVKTPGRRIQLDDDR